MLRLSDVRASYGAATVLQGVDLAIGAGETVALLGPNGAGKSTLLAAVTGTIARRSGSIRFDGAEIVRSPAHRIVESGVRLVPEGRLVFAPFSVEDNLRLGALRLKGDVRERFDGVYRLFPRLAERKQQPAGTLSGGEQQMLAIGRAMMSKPKLLLIDEASLGLSPALAKTVFQVVSKINDDGVTVIIVEQNVGVLPYADRALIMEKGTIVYQGVGDEIRNANLRERYLGGAA